MKLLKRVLIGAVAAAMLTGVCASAATVNADSDEGSVRAVQLQLTAVKLLEDSQVSGSWDENTIKAMMRFQRFVNDMQGAGTVEESGECDDNVAGYLEYAAGKGWDVASKVDPDSVLTPKEQEAAAQAEAEAQAAAEAAAAQKLIDDQASIAYVQTMLRTVGLLEEVTGEYDETTKNAIIRAQEFINETQGAGTVEVNGKYDDGETLIWLNTAANENWTIPLTSATPEPTAAAEGAEGTEAQDGANEAGKGIQPTVQPGENGITNFVVTVDGKAREGTVALTPGKHSIAWSAEGVLMYSMYMYTGDGQLINKVEGIPTTYFDLDTFGMASGATYEIRIGAVPGSGNVADMVWRSVFVTLQ